MAQRKNGNNGVMIALVVGGGLLLANTFNRTKNLVDNLRFEVVGFSPNWGGFSLRNFTLPGQLRVRFINPTPVAATFSNFFATLDYKGQQLGSANAPQAQTVAASGNTIISFPTEIRLDKLAQSLGKNWTTIVAERKLPQMRLKGTFNTKGLNIPIDSVV
jgi:LEA14-like dessication related protein